MGLGGQHSAIVVTVIARRMSCMVKLVANAPKQSPTQTDKILE